MRAPATGRCLLLQARKPCGGGSRRVDQPVRRQRASLQERCYAAGPRRRTRKKRPAPGATGAGSGGQPLDHPPALVRGGTGNRSCSRLTRPCQNSMTSGITRIRPRTPGIGTSVPSGHPPPEFGVTVLELGARSDHRATACWPTRRPASRAGGTGSRARCPRWDSAVDRPLDDHLPAQGVPREQQAGPRDLGQVGALAGRPVGVEDESVGIVAFQQNRPGPRPPAGRDRGQHHRGRLGGAARRPPSAIQAANWSSGSSASIASSRPGSRLGRG